MGLITHPHTSHNQSYWGITVSDLCDEVAVKDGDAVGDERGGGKFAGVGTFVERGLVAVAELVFFP